MKKLIYIIILLLIDQLTKFLSINKNITLIENLLYIKYSENPGIIFGLFSNNIFFITLLPILFIIFLIYLYKKERKTRLFSYAILLTITGLVCNMVDRLIYKHVIDFIFIPIYPKYNISLFNFADLFLILGIILLIYHFIIVKK